MKRLFKYTLVRVSKDKFDLLIKESEHSFKSVETGITYVCTINPDKYITDVMHLKIEISTDYMFEITERINKYDSEGIQCNFTRYIR